MGSSEQQKITFEEWLACSELLFEWSDTYDTKDWDRLRQILAPLLVINYANVNNAKFTDLPADEFVQMMRDPLFLGDPLVASQHLVGATKWRKVSDEQIVSYHQSRAAHQRFEDESRTAVAVKGHGHGLVTTTFKKIGGTWKWAGIQTKVYWNEHDFKNVFRGAAGKSG